MSHSTIVPAWGINTISIGSISVLTVRLRMLTVHLDENYLNSLHHLGVASRPSGKYTILRYTGLSNVYVSSEILNLLHTLRYKSALAQVHDKYKDHDAYSPKMVGHMDLDDAEF